MITSEIAEILKSYVYVYIDPRDGKPFYIGKGKESRLFSHLEDQSDSDKVDRIVQLREAGMEPQIELLRYGLSDAEAELVEAAAIDLIGIHNLTNRITGYHKSSYGRITSQEVIRMLSAKHVDVRHRAILITINRSYRSGMTAEELYETTRGIWRVGKQKDKAEYALALYQGIVLEVYRIRKWHHAGTLDYKTRDSSYFKNSGRWEFEGCVAEDEVRNEYVGFSVGKGGQNPIRYKNM